ncbi:unnamed protein product (macronuclear) [Paramecium tetraurelia]|uniref:Uncharacterized protein n=1 Tax=Paramecium tetraurelia TaxID=5888 RepID=A0CJ95_PARTE|nr:uncharacterized protein GSPATT00000572001 [Paramecium tetraurelia]CAK70862.1 unnamed protein product [Paramecium tetraurelia]|eukprot:XP_001438259.1 hypothetical protein (macronuclear) [Paramecium tetraurelia strain d4-2]
MPLIKNEQGEGVLQQFITNLQQHQQGFSLKHFFRSQLHHYLTHILIFKLHRLSTRYVLHEYLVLHGCCSQVCQKEILNIDQDFYKQLQRKDGYILRFSYIDRRQIVYSKCFADNLKFKKLEKLTLHLLEVQDIKYLMYGNGFLTEDFNKPYKHLNKIMTS